MRHRKAGKKLGRDSSHRKAMFRNMVTSLFKYEQIETTDAKAKELRSTAEKMITLAKKGDLHSRRQALAYIKEKAVTHKLFEQLKDRYLDRQGGYLRIIKKGNRKGDGAPISVIQLIPEVEGAKKDKKISKTPASASAAKSKKKKETAVKEEKKASLESDNEKGEKGGDTISKNTEKKDTI